MSKVAFLIDREFEDSEFQRPYEALAEDGHQCVIVGREAGETFDGKKGYAQATVEVPASAAHASDFDALVIPGGHSPDRLRRDPDVVRFTQEFFAEEKPVAAICHGPQVLVEAGVVEGRTLTSAPAIETDLENAGSRWIDQEVVEQGNLLTSRTPRDLEAFVEALRRRV